MNLCDLESDENSETCCCSRKTAVCVCVSLQTAVCVCVSTGGHFSLSAAGFVMYGCVFSHRRRCSDCPCVKLAYMR